MLASGGPTLRQNAVRRAGARTHAATRAIGDMRQRIERQWQLLQCRQLAARASGKAADDHGGCVVIVWCSCGARRCCCNVSVLCRRYPFWIHGGCTQCRDQRRRRGFRSGVTTTLIVDSLPTQSSLSGACAPTANGVPVRCNANL